MSEIFVIIALPFVFFWLHLLVGLGATGIVFAALRRVPTSHEVRGQLEMIAVLIAPVLLGIYGEDRAVGRDGFNVPSVGAAIDLFLLNLVLLYAFEKLCRRPLSSPPPRP